MQNIGSVKVNSSQNWTKPCHTVLLFRVMFVGAILYLVSQPGLVHRRKDWNNIPRTPTFCLN